MAQMSEQRLEHICSAVEMSSLKLRVEELEQREDRMKHSHALEVDQLKQELAEEWGEEREELLLQVTQLSHEKEELVDKVRMT